MSLSPLAIVVAVAEDGVIGKDDGLPWHLPEDLRHFKAVTMGHAIIMGRKTFQSIGRVLPGRRSIVVSRSPSLSIPGAIVVSRFEDAVAKARETDEEPRVIGGATIYEAALPLTTKIFLTEIRRKIPGDTFFPAFDRSVFREIERRKGDSEGVEFVTLAR